jgi:hypothetical protein
MLSSFRRKFTITQPSTPRVNPILDGQTATSTSLSNLLQPSAAGGSTAFTWDEFPSFDWPDAPDFSPDVVPAWLRDSNMADLGLPLNGSDGIFLPFECVSASARSIAASPDPRSERCRCSLTRMQHVSDAPWTFALDSSQFGAAW